MESGTYDSCPQYDSGGAGGTEGFLSSLIPLAHACAATPYTDVVLAPSCVFGQMMGQPLARVILRVTYRETGDWPSASATYTFGSEPGELALNQEHLVWDYTSNGRNTLRLTVNTTSTVTNLRVRSEDYSSGFGGVSFSTEVQYVGN